jgi:hypothetical protein
MRMVIFLACLIVFGFFVYWRVGTAKELVEPDYRSLDEQAEQIHTQTDTYKKPLEDINKVTKDAYQGLE